MKKYTLLSIALILSLNVIGQVGISNTEFLPNDNSMLEIKSGDATNPKGLRLPILDDTQETNITDKNTTLTLDERITQLEALLYYSEQTKQLMLHNGSEFTAVGVPLGGIIMWSGTEVPDGWVLCDGKMYDSQGNIVTHTWPDGVNLGDPGPNVWQTPYLQGRFIMGYNPNNTDFDQPGNLSQGLKESKWGEGLELQNTVWGKSGNYRIYDESSAVGPDIFDHPYYVLAFIMRIK